MNKLLACLMFLIIGLSLSCSKPQANNAANANQDLDRRIKAAQLSQADAEDLVTKLFADCEVDDPKNIYFPEFARQKLMQLAKMSHEGKVHLEAVSTIDKTSTTNLMLTTFLEDKITIFFFAPKYNIILVRDYGVNYKKQRTYPHEFKNTFMIGVVHEMTHLENPAIKDKGKWPEGLALEEEIRTWLKVNKEVVRPLRAMGQPLKVDFIEFDDIAIGCKDDPKCDAIAPFMQGKTLDTQ